MSNEEINEQGERGGLGVRVWESTGETIAPDAIYTAADIAHVLKHSQRWFRANRRALDREGFPRPISSVGRPRWRGEDLLTWLRRPKDDPAGGGNAVHLNAEALALVLAERAQIVAKSRRVISLHSTVKRSLF